jgi:hypothetical protein
MSGHAYAVGQAGWRSSTLVQGVPCMRRRLASRANEQPTARPWGDKHGSKPPTRRAAAVQAMPSGEGACARGPEWFATRRATGDGRQATGDSQQCPGTVFRRVRLQPACRRRETWLRGPRGREGGGMPCSRLSRAVLLTTADRRFYLILQRSRASGTRCNGCRGSVHAP